MVVTALTIAGSDSGGGAGIQADIKTMESLGVFGTSVITAVTSQNTKDVKGIEEISPSFVGEQMDAVVEDFDVKVAKTGMLSSSSIIDVVAEKIEQHDIPLVVDPVMVAASGDRLLKKEAEKAIEQKLLPHAKIITPNIPEAEVLTGLEINGEKSMRSAGKKIVDKGAQTALIKGGHLSNKEPSKNEDVENSIVDILYTSGSTEFRKPRIETEKTHGTGCAISSAIASELAKNKEIHTAVGNAEEYIYRAIKFGVSVGEKGCVHHLVNIRKDADIFNTMEKTRDAVDLFKRENISSLIPEVGFNFAVAPSYSLYEDEIVAIEGRLTKTLDGVSAKGIWMGVSDHVARFLLELREFSPDITAVCNIRNNKKILQKIEDLGWEVERFDRSEQPKNTKTMEWSVRKIMENRQKPPEIVVDSGDIGKEPMIRLISTTPKKLTNKVLKLDTKLN